LLLQIKYLAERLIHGKCSTSVQQRKVPIGWISVGIYAELDAQSTSRASLESDMPIFELTHDAIVPVEQVSLSALGIRERHDLQRILRTHIGTVSPDTLILAEEYREWEDSRRSIDLPADLTITSRSYQFDQCVMAGCSGQMLITREQRSVERFRKGHIDGIVSREIIPQIPDPRQKEIVRISAQGKVREVGESRAAAFAIDLSVRRISSDHLRDFDIEQMRHVQRLSRVE